MDGSKKNPALRRVLSIFACAAIFFLVAAFLFSLMAAGKNMPLTPEQHTLLHRLSLPLCFALAACVAGLAFALIRSGKMRLGESCRIRRERLELELAEARYRILVMDMDVIIFEANFIDKTISANEAYENIFGEKPQFGHLMTGHRLHPDDRGDYHALVVAIGKRLLQNATVELRFMAANGNYVWFSLSVSAVSDDVGNVVRLVGKMTNIDKQKRETEFLKVKAQTDLMTGLYNKAATEEMIKRALSESPNMTHALLIIDIDDLKGINDGLGHVQGDRVIRGVAVLLQKHFRSSDIIGRIGGDEFMVFLRSFVSEEQLKITVTSLVRQFSAIRAGEDGGRAVHASIGMALTGEGINSFNELYKNADTALYHVKRNGKNDYAAYTPEMELTGYQYSRSTPSAPGGSGRSGSLELDRLIHAVSSFFPIIISANITKNSYYMMEYIDPQAVFPAEAGCFDELITVVSEALHPADCDAFLQAFSRERLLSAYAQHENAVTCEVRRQNGDGSCRLLRITAVFAESDAPGDVSQIILVQTAEA